MYSGDKEVIIAMFTEYGDIVSVAELQKMLGIGRDSAYKLLQEQHIYNVKIGKKYIIAKQSVIEFLTK